MTLPYSSAERKPPALAFLHTSPVLIPVFADLAKRILPEFQVFHMTDESLIRNTIAAGELTHTTTRRVALMIESAQLGGADAVMVTCSSIGGAVPAARPMFDFPIFRIDEAMAEKAVASGGRIGVAATLRTTLNPTIALLRDTAAQFQRDVEIVPSLCEGAFEAVLAGDTEKHDRILIDSLSRLMRDADVVVLAQASMARVIPKLESSSATVLSSPELAVRRARDILMPRASNV